MMVLPNAPASKCDMCGQVHFDPRFELTMQFMLDQLAAQTPQPAPWSQLTPEPAQTWATARRSG